MKAAVWIKAWTSSSGGGGILVDTHPRFLSGEGRSSSCIVSVNKVHSIKCPAASTSLRALASGGMGRRLLMPFPPPLPPMPQPPDDVLQVVVGEPKRIERLGEDFATSSQPFRCGLTCGEWRKDGSCLLPYRSVPPRTALSRCVPIYGIPTSGLRRSSGANFIPG